MRHREIITEMAIPLNVRMLIDELMAILQLNLPGPEIKIVNHINARVLGSCSWRYGKRPILTTSGMVSKYVDYCDKNTIVILEKAILGDDKTLRRVLAHELCHHAQNLINDTEDFNNMGFDTFRFRQKFKDGHGAEWREYASIFNAKYGADFVTKFSDQSYVLAPNEKPFYVVLEPWHSLGKIYKRCYAYTVRPSEKQKKYLQNQYEPWKMFKTTDQDFLGAKLGAQGWSSVGEIGEKFDKWNDLWNNGEVIASGNLKE